MASPFTSLARKTLKTIRAGGGHDVSSEARDFHGRWTRGGGGVRPEGEVAGAPRMKFRDLFTQMTKEGKGKSEILKAAQGLGYTNLSKRYGMMMKEVAKAGGGAGVVVTAVKTEVKTVAKAPIDTDMLGAARRGWGTGSREDAIRSAENALKANEHGFPVEGQRVHGMANYEPMMSFKMEHMEIHYTASNRKAVANMLADYSRNPIPLEVTAHTRAMYFSDQANKEDAYWAKRYNTTHFKSAATGGDGRIVFYKQNDSGHHIIATTAHEMGHNLARGVYHDSDPGSNSPIGKLYDAWKANPHSAVPPPTDYGRNSRSEAFAEAVSVRFTHAHGRASSLNHHYSIALDEALHMSRVKILGRG